MTGMTMQRRNMLSLMTGATASAAFAGPAWAAAMGRCQSVLATPEQAIAEKAFFEVLRDPRLPALQARLKAELAKGSIGRTAAGAATIDRAVAAWTHSLLFHELARVRSRPAVIWGTDDTPRRWMGYELPGVGSAGDNPDAIYRTAALDSSKSYELTGRIDRENPAAQLVIQVDRADATNPASMFDMNTKRPSIASATLGIFTDKDLQLGPDGSFRITVGGEADGPYHVPMKDGVVGIGLRDMLSDWRQRPAEVQVRERGVPVSDVPEQLDIKALADALVADLPGYIGFWGGFPDVWFGGLKPNTISAPRPRHKGWGYVAGMHFLLEPGHAAVIRTSREDAPYTGFQMCDPWMINGDVRAYQLCLNASQVTPDSDGATTYVLCPEDPGVANWIDTEGLNQGLCVIRWQGTTEATDAAKLIQDFKVVPLSEVAGMTTLARVTPHERKVTLARRAIDYASRTRGPC
ncbi:MAG: hypothetical protein KDE55_03005 [Novosphingobium sp.]|nr:hypothetical protein [Novosphingobium sp.]